MSDVQLGVIGSAFMWVYALMLPIAGAIGDRVSRKKLIVGGLIFWSAVTLCTALSRTFGQLVVFRAIEGLGEAFYFPAAMSLVSDYHGPATRSRAMAICQSSVYAGTSAGGAVAGALADHWGWRAGFYLFGSCGVALGLALVVLLREPTRGLAEGVGPHGQTPEIAHPSGSGGLAHSLAVMFGHPVVVLLVAVFMCANFVASVFLTWMPSFLSGKFHMTLAMAGLNGTIWIQVASVLGVVTGGVVADALARRLRGGRMVTQLLGLTLGIPFLFLTGHVRSATPLISAMVGFGFFKGIYDANLWASLYDVVPTDRRGVALGVMNSLGWAGGGIAPVAIAVASQRYGLGSCISATSIVYATGASLLAIAIVLRTRPSKEQLR